MSVKTLNACLAIMPTFTLSVLPALTPNAHSAPATRTENSAKVRPATINKVAPPMAETPEDLHRFEVRVAPAPMVFAKWYVVDAAIRINKNFSIGPSAIYYQSVGLATMFSPSRQGSAYGFNATLYADSVEKSTWFLGLHVLKESYKQHGHASIYREELEGFKEELTAGFQFILWPRVNLLLGFGVEHRDYKGTKTSLNSDNIYDVTDRGLYWPSLELKIGIEI